MVRPKLKMELIADEKSRYRTFQNRQKGLRKKLHELSTLCDVKACMILYGPNANGTYSSQPDIWPENGNEVECIIEEYMRERKKDHGKRTLDLTDVLQSRKRTLDLSDVLQIRKKTTNLELRKMQEKNGKTKAGVDEFSCEKLVEIIDKLDKKHEAVQNMIDLKKGKATSMSETTWDCSHMQGLSAVNPLDTHVPIDYSTYRGTRMTEYNLGFDDQGMGVVASNLGFMMNRVGMMKVENNEYTELGGDRASSSGIQYNNVQCQDPIHSHPALGVSENMVVNFDRRIPMQYMLKPEPL